MIITTGMGMNDIPRVKRNLIAALDDGRAAARAFVESLSPDLPVHDDSDWTARDLIIHLMALEADMIAAMQSAIDGEAFSVDLRGEVDAPALYELRRRDRAHLSWDELLLEWERTRHQLRGVVLAFPVERMGTPFSNPFFVDYDLIGAVRACGAHEREHLAEMRAALVRREQSSRNS
ncbi:MAG: DinB family protein [Chloroflexi bacterium]|nr:DinB family protein [Chloroflexota bacterium]